MKKVLKHKERNRGKKKRDGLKVDLGVTFKKFKGFKEKLLKLLLNVKSYLH